MPRLEIRFEIFCAQCGAGMCQETFVDESNGIKLRVGICQVCAGAAQARGYAQGLKDGAKVKECTNGKRN